MAIIAFVSQKGGVGKSTLSRAVARDAALAELDVKIADLDPQQGTSTRWQQRRLAARIEPNLRAEMLAGAGDAKRIAGQHDLLIIDGPARASRGTLEIAEMADLVVQPVSGCIDDIEPAIELFRELVEKGIPRKRLKIALNRISTEAEAETTRLYVSQSGFDVLPGCLYDRAVYKTAHNFGKAATEVGPIGPRQAAKQLVEAITKACLAAAGAATPAAA